MGDGAAFAPAAASAAASAAERGGAPPFIAAKMMLHALSLAPAAANEPRSSPIISSSRSAKSETVSIPISAKTGPKLAPQPASSASSHSEGSSLAADAPAADAGAGSTGSAAGGASPTRKVTSAMVPWDSAWALISLVTAERSAAVLTPMLFTATISQPGFTPQASAIPPGVSPVSSNVSPLRRQPNFCEKSIGMLMIAPTGGGPIGCCGGP